MGRRRVALISLAFRCPYDLRAMWYVLICGLERYQLGRELHETDRFHIIYLAIQHCSSACPRGAGQAPRHRLAQSLYDTGLSTSGSWEARAPAITRIAREVWGPRWKERSPRKAP